MAPCCTRKRYKQASTTQPQPASTTHSAATSNAPASQSHFPTSSGSMRSCARVRPVTRGIHNVRYRLRNPRVTRHRARICETTKKKKNTSSTRHRHPAPQHPLPPSPQKTTLSPFRSKSVSVVLRSSTLLTLRHPSSSSPPPVAHASVTSKPLQQNRNPPPPPTPQQHHMRLHPNLTFQTQAGQCGVALEPVQYQAAIG